MKIWTVIGIAVLIPALTGGCGVEGVEDAHAMESDEFLGNFNFLLEVEGITGDQTTIIGGFKKMSGMNSETEVIEFQDGNDPTLRKRPGRALFGNITMERGYTATDDLWEWRKQIEGGQTIRRNGAIVVTRRGGTTVARYNLFEAWPSKWSVPDIHTDASDFSEAITLTVERVERGSPSVAER